MPRSISRWVRWCGWLTLAAAVGGCQRGPTWHLAPVEGTITQGGHPLASIRVTFWADVEAGTQGPRASGFTDAAGHYELRTDTGDRGAVIGRYRVCLVGIHYQAPNLHPDANLLGRMSKTTANAKEVQERMKRVQMEKSAPLRVPLSYGQPDKTPLRVEVQPGWQVIDFDVKGNDVEVKPIGGLDTTGKQLKRFASQRIGGFPGGIDLLSNGHILITQPECNKVAEYDMEGKMVLEVDAHQVTTATGLPNGHFLVASPPGQRVFEVDRAGKTVWEFKGDDNFTRARRR